MFVVQASRLPKAAETAVPQLLSNLRLSWNKALARPTSVIFATTRITLTWRLEIPSESLGKTATEQNAWYAFSGVSLKRGVS